MRYWHAALVGNYTSRSGDTASLEGGDGLIRLAAFLPEASFDQLRAFQEQIRAYFPNADRWLREKFVPDVALSRRRLIVLAGDGGLRGFVIAKRIEEPKICSLWIDPRYRGESGVDGLVELAKDWIGTDRPLFTMPDELGWVGKRLGFEMPTREIGAYGRADGELSFNQR